MPLDGLRAWIGEVERKLGMRTRVFLALAAIAIGVGGAAIYVALDTRDTAVSESDVRALQEQLEERIAAGGVGGGDVTQLEAEFQELKAEVERLRGGRGGGQGQGGGDGRGGGGAQGGAGDQGPGGAGQGGAGASGGAQGGDAQRLRELFEEATGGEDGP